MENKTGIVLDLSGLKIISRNKKRQSFYTLPFYYFTVLQVKRKWGMT